MNYNPKGEDKNKIIVYYILLICQVKYDLTGIEINPEYWYGMRLTDYAKIKFNLDEVNNDVVKRLKLQKFLYIN